jgi:hypothetical protein
MMRVVLCAILTLACLIGHVTAAPQEEMRYGVALDTKTYPQTTPQEALASVVKAIEGNRVDYVLAYLAVPRTVDATVRNDFDGNFVHYVRAMESKLTPDAARLFIRFVKEGEWKIQGDSASATLKDVKDKGVFLLKVDGRWRLESRYRLESKDPEDKVD